MPDPVADAEELLDLLLEHRRAKVAATVRATPMSRELDLPALNALQCTIETIQRVVAQERHLATMAPATAGLSGAAFN